MEKKNAKENTEKLTLAVQEKTMAEEKKEEEWEERCKEVARLETEVAQLRSQEVNQGVFANLVVKKLLQTTDFGELVVKMSVTATNIGKHKTLKTLMSEYPQLRLRKKQLAWDLFAKDRANKLQHELLKGEHEFKLLMKISKQEKPLSLEQLKDMTTDYDEDLDDVVGEMQEVYPCEDENVPLLCLVNTPSAEIQTPVEN